jgi:hypothetical protein
MLRLANVIFTCNSLTWVTKHVGRDELKFGLQNVPESGGTEKAGFSFQSTGLLDVARNNFYMGVTQSS